MFMKQMQVFSKKTFNFVEEQFDTTLATTMLQQKRGYARACCKKNDTKTKT